MARPQKTYMYILTPQGIEQKAKITVNFLKRKMNEYEKIKQEIKKLKRTLKLRQMKRLSPKMVAMKNRLPEPWTLRSLLSICMHRLVEGIYNPLIEAFVAFCSCSRNFAMKKRRNTKVEPTGVWFVRGDTSFFAVFKVFFDYCVETFNCFRNCFAVKADNIPCVNYPADKNPIFKIGFNVSNVVFV